MFFFTKQNERRTLRGLYEAWRAHHAAPTAMAINAVYLLIAAAVVPCEAFAYPEYLRADLLSKGIGGAVAVGLLLWLRVAKRAPRRPGWIMGFAMLAAPISISLQYIYFASFNDPRYAADLLLGAFASTMLSGFALYRFWRSHYLYHVYMLAAWIAATAAGLVAPRMLTLMASIHLTVFWSFTYYRRLFVGQLFERYHNLATFIPRKVAYEITVDGSRDLGALFAPKERFTVCLCSDWRNYQRVASQHSPEVVSGMLETYYEAVLQTLDRHFPGGAYLASWNADELFVIVYDEADRPDERQLVRQTFAFAVDLATATRETVNATLPMPIDFDVGLASGNGLLGLHGPRHMKKTTITGPSPGLAKRLEQEAKGRRKQTPGVEGPCIAMTSAVWAQLDAEALDPDAVVEATTATVKDLEGSGIHIYRPTPARERRAA